MLTHVRSVCYVRKAFLLTLRGKIIANILQFLSRRESKLVRKNSKKLPKLFHQSFTVKFFKQKRPECPFKQYITMPLRCFKCNRFGHIAEKCRGKKRCAKCGREHTELGTRYLKVAALPLLRKKSSGAAAYRYSNEKVAPLPLLACKKTAAAAT